MAKKNPALGRIFYFIFFGDYSATTVAAESTTAVAVESTVSTTSVAASTTSSVASTASSAASFGLQATNTNANIIAKNPIFNVFFIVIILIFNGANIKRFFSLSKREVYIFQLFNIKYFNLIDII
jgi:hypothetical protein